MNSYNVRSMKKRPLVQLVFSKLKFTLLLLSCMSWLPRVLYADQKPPNIILFLVDDLGWSDLQCYGSRFHETPNIDAMAAKGWKFTQAYAACHVCSPTRASVMTGKYPARLQLTDWLPGRTDHPFQKLLGPRHRLALPHEEFTLPEALKKHGYRTAHIGKWHLGEEPFGPTAQGFDLQIPRWNKGWPKSGFHAPFELEALADKPGDYLTDRLTDEAELFIEDCHQQPFFLYLSHFAVHDPIQGRKDLVAHYEAKKMKMDTESSPPFLLEGNPDDLSPASRDLLNSMIEKPAWSGHKILPERTVKIKQRQDNVQFAAMVTAIDESLGRILAKLKSLKIEDNTIIVFFSDNGGMSAANFGNPDRIVGKKQLDAAYSSSNLPLRGAKGWLYEGGIRVPMIVQYPALQSRGRVCDLSVISNDLYPTILELANLPARPEQHRDGVSLAGLIKGTANSLERPALYWHFPHYSNHGMQSPCAAVRSGDYKLIEYFENNTIQLFNLQTDIGEQNDLSRLEPNKADELRGMLHQWYIEVGAQMPQSK